MSAPASPDQEWTGDQDNQQQAEESFDQNRAEEEETPDENAPHSPEYAPSPDGPASPDNGNDYPGSPEETQEVSNQMAAEKETRDEDERREEAQQNPAGSDKDSDDELNIRRKRILDSDDEEGETKVSPSKKKITVSSDEDSDSERAKPKGKLLSDQSDDSGNEGRKGGEEVGELMANIFGEDSDEDEDNEFKEKPVNDEEEDEDRNERPPRDDDEDDRPSRDPGHEWDFDEMMKRKKAERKRQRKRRGDGVDIINDDDGRIALMVEKMKAATKDDRIANQNRMPALKKRKMLAEVKMMLLRTEMYEAIIENGMMSAVSDWLAPLPDKSLPALEIRTDLLKLLCDSFSRLDQGVLKQSGLGRAVMMLYKHPKELKPNKEMASKLIREWSRPIFQLDTDFRSVTREERESRDQERMPEAKRRRLSVEGATSSKKAEEAAKEPQINRARVPRVSTKDYVVRPKHLVEGEFKGEKKGRAYDRLNKAQRDFQERTKKMKVKRAVQVSLEGRNMAI